MLNAFSKSASKLGVAWLTASAAKTAAAVILCILLVPANAQSLDVRQAPPKMVFDAPEIQENEDEGIEERLVKFPSAVSTTYPENDIVTVKLFTPKNLEEKKIPFVVVLHYWGASDERLERAMAAEMNRKGIGVALMALPFHLARTPKGFRSGELAIQPDPALMRLTMVQAVSDVRRTLDFLETLPEADTEKLGIAGISLGSIITALAYAVEPRLDAAAFMLGGADLAHILWNSSRVVRQRDALRSKGFVEERLRAELASVEPLTYLPERLNPRAFVVGGRFDTVIPPTDTQKLIAAMPGAKSLLLDTGHYGGVFIQKRVIRSISEFMEAEFAGQPWDPPKSVYAPTLRIGAELSFESKLQVGVGVDLFASPKRDLFLSLLVTPKGPKLFGGYNLDKNLALGIFGSPKTVSFGVFWSTIL